MILSRTQVEALKMVEKRDWPAGEPQAGWFNVATYQVIKRKGLVEELPSGVVHLTQRGRAALVKFKEPLE